MSKKTKTAKKQPAIIWRHVLGIVKSRQAQREKAGEVGPPTNEDFSLAFATAITKAREKGYIKSDGLELTAKGRELEKAKLLEPGNAEKEKEYRALLGKRRMQSILSRVSKKPATKGKKTSRAPRATRSSLASVVRESKRLATAFG